MEVHCQLEQTSLATTQQQLSRVQYVMTGVKVSLIGDWKSNPHASIDGDLTDLIPTEALTPVNKQVNKKKR